MELLELFSNYFFKLAILNGDSKTHSSAELSYYVDSVYTYIFQIMFHNFCISLARLLAPFFPAFLHGLCCIFCFVLSMRIGEVK